MNKVLVTALSAILFTSTVQADAIGVYLGGQVWDNKASGIFGESGGQTNFQLADEQQGSSFIAIEHPIPFIPNARISHTSLETKGMTQLDSDIQFDGYTFASGRDVNANFDVSYTDYTLYYEFFDNGLFSFDLGITGRDFDGDVSLSGLAEVSNDGSTSTIEVTGKIATDEMVPMLYASTIVGLPFTGVDLFAQGNFLSLDDHTLYDYQAGVSYEAIDNLAVDVSFSLGYRAVKLELEDLNNLYSNLEFKGVFAGVTVHF
ncbi:TIGR04219 family outer membrane beta-barrel protein [Thalassotalea sediminis]|uniref:TIGR04219 family outer membrane beta-barrel protein n=1 Tax=Thalassotalea sediminis TaxID=1759089 RepID=UPI00257342F2|nr:TIGR04219 family outer membrane beta-barrel protein [Thalassotalea sediminis]